MKKFTQRQLNGGAAALLIVAGLLFVLTDTLAPAVIGLALTLGAAVLVFLSRNAPTENKD